MHDLEDVLVLHGTFRTHFLLPHRVVGAIKYDAPTFKDCALTVDRPGRYIYSYQGTPFLQVNKQTSYDPYPTPTHPATLIDRITVRALREVWLQEPGFTTQVKNADWYQGVRVKPWAYTSPRYPLRMKDAYVATLHFSRVRDSPKYTDGILVSHREGLFLFRASRSFERLLDNKAVPPPWQHCAVFGEGYPLRGTAEAHEQLRRWELAPLRHAATPVGQMHFLAWTGGAGAVTNAKGRTPPPGQNVTAGDGYDKLWQPKSWRKLTPQHKPITVTLRAQAYRPPAKKK